MSTEITLKDRFIPARELKRRGIAAFDDILAECPIFIVKNDQPKYVIMTEARYRELLDEADEASEYRVKESLEDIKAGRFREMTMEEIVRDFGLDEDE